MPTDLAAGTCCEKQLTRSAGPRFRHPSFTLLPRSASACSCSGL